MREVQFRHVKMRQKPTPDFLSRMRFKRLTERLFSSVEIDPVAGVSQLLDYAQQNPDSPEANSLRHYFNAFVEEPAVSVSDAVVDGLIDWSLSSQTLAVSMIDDVACQISGGYPQVSSFNDGYDEAVQAVMDGRCAEREQMLLKQYQLASEGGDKEAERMVSILEASLWARDAARRASEETARTMLLMQRKLELSLGRNPE